MSSRYAESEGKPRDSGFEAEEEEIDCCDILQREMRPKHFNLPLPPSLHLMPSLRSRVEQAPIEIKSSSLLPPRPLLPLPLPVCPPSPSLAAWAVRGDCYYSLLHGMRGRG